MRHRLRDRGGRRNRSTFEAQLGGGIGIYRAGQVPPKNEVNQHAGSIHNRELADLMLVHQTQRLNRSHWRPTDDGTPGRNRDARSLQRLRPQDGAPDIAVAQQTKQFAVRGAKDQGSGPRCIQTRECVVDRECRSDDDTFQPC